MGWVFVGDGEGERGVEGLGFGYWDLWAAFWVGWDELG